MGSNRTVLWQAPAGQSAKLGGIEIGPVVPFARPSWRSGGGHFPDHNRVEAAVVLRGGVEAAGILISMARLRPMTSVR